MSKYKSQISLNYIKKSKVILTKNINIIYTKYEYDTRKEYISYSCVYGLLVSLMRQ